MSQERRDLTGPVEIRADEKPKLVGYAAVFNQRTDIIGLFEEQIAPGAFTDAIGSDDVRALFNHDPNYVLGRTTAGTLTLREDKRGLRYEIDPPESRQDVVEAVRRGDVQGSSFAFDVLEESWDHSAKPPVRTIQKAKLYDVGPVTFPAYEQTTVSMRCREEAGRCVPPPDLSVERSRWTLAQIA